MKNYIPHRPNCSSSCTKSPKVGKSCSKLVEDETEVAIEFNRFFASAACEQNPCPSPPQAKLTQRQSTVTSLVLATLVEEQLIKIIQQLPAMKLNDTIFISVWLIKKNAQRILYNHDLN
ncbi:hypothetical protein J6590_045183 [Homalodisca vitripennis]|nr:hypothetical protein J6590_045183 [Homalodisca vitripennis]